MGRIEQSGNARRNCTQRGHQYRERKDIFGPLAKTPRVRNWGAIFPYFHPAFSNIDNLKIGIRDKIRPNRPVLTTPAVWAEIVKWNPPPYMAPENNQHKTNQQPTGKKSPRE